MPQLAPIVLADGATTPVNRTFSPKSIENGILASLEEATGVPVVRPTLRVSVRKPVNKSGMYRIKVTIDVPASQVVDGVTSAHHTNSVNTEFAIHESSTTQEINDLFAFNKNAWANALLIDAVKTQTPFY